MKENTALDTATIDELRAEVERLLSRDEARTELYRLSQMGAEYQADRPRLRVIAGSARKTTAPRGRLAIVAPLGGVA